MSARLRRGGLATGFGVLAVMGLAGCLHGGPLAKARPDDPIAAARQLDHADVAVRDGDAVGSCGEYHLDQGERLPARAGECLRAGAGAAGAELAWTSPTTEGDPIVSFAFVGRGVEGVRVLTTSTFDSYGGLENGTSWTEEVCADPASIDVPGACEESSGE